MTKTIESPHFEVTAGLIFRSGKVLISRRRRGSHLAGMWEFPGGKREEGESLEECLERELTEELGIRTRVEGHCLTIDHAYDDRSISLHFFHCTLLGGEPEPLQSDGIKWVAPSALGRLAFPPPDKKAIAYLSRHGAE
ncbi:MAG: (deoxy)nucleoside triphosphate pyrophosphohydrolase [Desulfatiglandaceae bacterium]